MPKRLVDGEAVWTSDKLAKVEPLEFRAEYTNLLPLAEADGTFEANARRVWKEVYSYNRQDITVDLVEDILDEFERVGMLLRKKDEDGKVWGYWVGIESRLPSISQRDKYKPGKASLFKNLTSSTETLELVQSEFDSQPEPVKTGLVRIGKDSSSNGSELPVVDLDSAVKPGTYRPGLYTEKRPKNLHKHIVRAWQEIKGPSAIARYPSRFPQRWEELCENHSGDLIVPAFELWAEEEGIYSNTEYPISDFLKVAAKYMERVLPTNKKEKSPMAGWTINENEPEMFSAPKQTKEDKEHAEKYADQI